MSLNTGNYRRAIKALGEFINDVSGAVTGMKTASSNCLNASNNDVYIKKHVTELEHSLEDYVQILAKAQDTLELMKKELTKALELDD